MRDLADRAEDWEIDLLHGARCAVGPYETLRASVEIQDGRIVCIRRDTARLSLNPSRRMDMDLTGYLIMPGLVNAHDHLQFALYPRLGDGPYSNYIEWGEDIHAVHSVTIAKHKSVPRDVRLWWGGIRNLLCGVTTVCHHDRLWPALQSRDFSAQGRSAVWVGAFPCARRRSCEGASGHAEK